MLIFGVQMGLVGFVWKYGSTGLTAGGVERVKMGE